MKRFAYWCHNTFGNWSPLRMIHGGPDGKNQSLYLMRMMFTWSSPWGQLYLHVFYREDLDRDPHDHPFDFWTFPLNTGYTEEVFIHGGELLGWEGRDGESLLAALAAPLIPALHCFREQHVARWRWHHRPATHTHRILRADSGRWPLVTLVWRGPTTRRWGFWTYAETRLERRWTHWKKYVYGTGVDNIEGDADVSCPGVGR